nr:immunoglobulin heavy chain junction region [Macaca mulatta]MOW75421.1 immunoglobulin heavy chain junction region [Macaca mulatta]MOW76004.1 immunoglobulin heavy chain junction region [Macaca mulatta]MOW76142.1 immunoglobulin heavy chain junction region [Macaca mulatta]MOW76598.1 immunoglobulin heavy chain junction region [Macaca mulatta]
CARYGMGSPNFDYW